MNTMSSPTEIENKSTQTEVRNQQLLRVVVILSRVVTVIFLIALVWAIYQALVNQRPLPLWAWLGIVAIFAAAIGLGVAVIVYRGVAKQVGPFDFRPSSLVAGELTSETRNVQAGGATSLNAAIKMMAGTFQLLGGAMDIMDASFTYDDADWKPPSVEYSVDDAGVGSLIVEQKATGRPAMRQGRCEWVLRLSQDLPMNLSVRVGAGKADMRLGAMTLDQLHVEGGVGELALDLSGEWKQSMRAFIKSGIGDTTLRLPQNVGVRIQSTVGLGSIQTQNLNWDSQAYTNALYGQSAVSLDITIEGGMGKINLI